MIREKIKLNIMDILLIMLIVLSALPREYSLWSYLSGIQNRPFGSSLGISTPFILLGLMYFINLKNLGISISRKPRIIVYFFVFIIITLSFPIAGRIWELSFIGIFYCLIFLGIYTTLSKRITYAHFEKSLDIGFSVALIIQSTLGILFVFADMSIPYISQGSTSIRNDLSRMTGTLAHPGDFSLYISVIYLYFVSKLLFKNDKKSIVFIILSFIDLYFSGARSMLVASGILTLIVLWRKIKNNIIYILLTATIGSIVAFRFYRSNTFRELFIENSIIDMFIARLIHWKLGFEIFFSNISNFFFGVGLNNHVDYIDANYSKISYLLTNSTILDEEFVRGMPIHNSFLIIAVELGVVALILYISIFISAIKKAVLILRIFPEYKFACYFIISSMMAFTIYGSQGWALLKPFGWILFIIVNAFLYSIEKQIYNIKSFKQYENEGK